MKGFSQRPAGTIGILKWGFLALLTIGFVRFLAGLVGVPIAIGGKLLSLTIVLLIAVVLYGVHFARKGGKIGDVVVSTIALVVAYTAVLAVFLSSSVWLDLGTYYTDPSHFRGELGSHIAAHLQVIPFLAVVGTVLSAVSFGVTRLIHRFNSSRRSRGGTTEARA